VAAEGVNGRPYRRMRAKILKANNICAYCGKPGADSVDHKVPRSLGGSLTDPKNLQPMHRSCNSKKGNGENRKLPHTKEW
jgi:5-methylcytosine-specific restriction endonuclease McrA